MLRKFISIICCCVVASLVSAQTGLVGTVTKFDQGNPTLGIVNYSGDAAGRSVLEGMLIRADWFKVLASGQANRAQVQLQVNYAANAYNAAVQVAGRSGSFTVQGSGATPNAAAAALTDALLKNLFKVPALCTRPIAFVMPGQKGMKELFTCAIDGSGQKRLTFNNAISSEPSWGHANALVYTLNQGTSLSIVLMDTAANRQRIVSSARGLNASAALSPNGRYVALPLSLGQQVDLFLLDLSNGMRKRLTQDRDVESSPTFSPDGQQICFVSDRAGRPQLFIISIDGGNARRLALGGGECVSPDWSPVTNQLCFAMHANSGQYVVAVMDMKQATPTPTVITEAAGNWEAPSWAPDGRHIVCTRQSGRTQDLYLLDSWFRTFQPITKNAFVSLPAWAPAY